MDCCVSLTWSYRWAKVLHYGALRALRRDAAAAAAATAAAATAAANITVEMIKTFYKRILKIALSLSLQM